MPTEQFLNSLIINKVDTKSTFDAMKAAGKINPDELYLVEEEPIDSVPTEGSNNPVTSGGVKTYVDNALANVGGGGGYVVSEEAPSDTNLLWIKGGIMKYYNPSTSTWENIVSTWG